MRRNAWPAVRQRNPAAHEISCRTKVCYLFGALEVPGSETPRDRGQRLFFFFSTRHRTGRRAYRARAGSWIPKLEDSVYLRRRNHGALGALGRLEEANGLRSEWRQNYQRDKKISGRGSSTRSKEAK